MCIFKRILHCIFMCIFLIYISSSYTNYYYNNNHSIMGIFSCPCVLPWWCVFGGKQGLVKTFTAWQKLASWQEMGAVSEAERYWGIFCRKNNGREPDGNI